jgi:hypothetical protein
VGLPERLAKIDVANTLTEIEKVFVELVEETAAMFVINSV